MATATYRYDYAKFVLNLPRGLFQQYYHRLNEASHTRKYHGDWLKSHHVQALNAFDVDRETTVIEIWGEWTGIITALPFDVWAPALKRLDVRAIVWDADQEAVLAVGQRLQRNLTSYNIEVFNSRPASKRLGRDRGGSGFRIGSRKSDLCLVVYKRTGEPAAQEYRLQGRYLRQALEQTERSFAGESSLVDRWSHLLTRVQSYGDVRLARSFEQAGIGTYWPVFAREGRDDYSAVQSSFADQVRALGTDPDRQCSPDDYDEPPPPDEYIG